MTMWATFDFPANRYFAGSLELNSILDSNDRSIDPGANARMCADKTLISPYHVSGARAMSIWNDSVA